MTRKKITHKEFIEILEKCDCDMYANYDCLLNALACFLHHMSKQSYDFGCVHSGDRDEKRWRAIYHELEKRGYYD